LFLPTIKLGLVSSFFFIVNMIIKHTMIYQL
jgi:hypothetical protein